MLLDIAHSRAMPSARGTVLRIVRFAVGLALCATAIWLMVRANLGLSPWDVLHSGISRLTGVPFGDVLMATGLVVLVASAAFGVRPGAGTLINIAAIGTLVDVLLASPLLSALPTGPVALRCAVLIVAVGLLGLGTAIYITAAFGAGPRDSLMVAATRHGLAVGRARAGIELTVLVVGWLLGGRVGVGTVLVAAGTGPAVHAGFRLLRHEP